MHPQAPTMTPASSTRRSNNGRTSSRSTTTSTTSASTGTNCKNETKMTRKRTTSSSHTTTATSSSFVASLPSRHRKRRQSTMSRFQKRLKNKSSSSRNGNGNGNGSSNSGDNIVESTTAAAANDDTVDTEGSDVGSTTDGSSTTKDSVKSNGNEHDNDNDVELNGKSKQRGMARKSKSKSIEAIIEIIDSQDGNEKKDGDDGEMEQKCDNDSNTNDGDGDGLGKENGKKVQVETIGVDNDKNQKSIPSMTPQKQHLPSSLPTQKITNMNSSSSKKSDSNKNKNHNSEQSTNENQKQNGGESNEDLRPRPQFPPISFSLEESQSNSLDFVKSLITNDVQNSQLSTDAAATPDHDSETTRTSTSTSSATKEAANQQKHQQVQLTTQINQLITSHVQNHIQSLEDQLSKYKQKQKSLERKQVLQAQQLEQYQLRTIQKCKSKEVKYKSALEECNTQIVNFKNENRSLQRQVCTLQDAMDKKDCVIGDLKRKLKEESKSLVEYKNRMMSWLQSVGFQFGSNCNGSNNSVVFSKVVQWNVSPPPQLPLQNGATSSTTATAINNMDTISSTDNNAKGSSKNLDDATKILPSSGGAVDSAVSDNMVVIGLNNNKVPTSNESRSKDKCIGLNTTAASITDDATKSSNRTKNSSKTSASTCSTNGTSGVSTAVTAISDPASSPAVAPLKPSRVCTASPVNSTKSFSITKVNHNNRPKVSLSPKRLDYQKKYDEEGGDQFQSRRISLDLKSIGGVNDDDIDNDCDSSTSDGGGASVLEDEEGNEDYKNHEKMQSNERESEINDFSKAAPLDSEKLQKQGSSRSTNRGQTVRFNTAATILNKASSLGNEDIHDPSQRLDLKRKRGRNDFDDSDSTTMSIQNVASLGAERTASTRDALSKPRVQLCLPINEKLPSTQVKTSAPAPSVTSKRQKTHAGSNQSSWQGREKTKTHKFKYQEVVRGKRAREALRGFDCEECRAFINAVCDGPGGQVFDRNSMVMKCSRHRSNFSPPKTPDGFWELSFADERTGNLAAVMDGESENGSQSHISEEV